MITQGWLVSILPWQLKLKLWNFAQLRLILQINAAGYRSSHQRCSMKKGVPRKFVKLTGKHQCQCLFFNKVADLRPGTLLKNKLWHGCFPVSFTNFLGIPFLQNTSGRLLLRVAFRDVFRTLSNTWDVVLYKNIERLKTAIFFKTIHLRCFAGFWIRSWLWKLIFVYVM